MTTRPNQEVRVRAWSLLLGISIFLAHAPAAMAQPVPDPDPIPTLDFGDTSRSMSVRLHFLDPLVADVESAEVVSGIARGRAGDPPLLRVDIEDLGGTSLEAFHAWHPLWAFVWNSDPGGGPPEFRMIHSEASGTFVFPFRPDLATMRVVDIPTQQEIISVDLIPPLHRFCRDNPTDADCADVVNRAPVCDADGPYQAECAGPTTSVMLDGTGSSDLDEDPLAYTWSGTFSGSPATGPDPTVPFPGFGLFAVDLEVADDFDGATTCSAEVAVVDTLPPLIECNAPATIVPSDAPIAFRATASDGCVGPVEPEITAFDCFTFTKKGKRIDKTRSCEVAVEGDTVRVLDSGGVGDHIQWSVTAMDASGNQASATCEVLVVRQGQ